MLILPLDYSEPYFATLGVMLYPAADGADPLKSRAYVAQVLGVSYFWGSLSDMSKRVDVEARGDLLIVTESKADFVAIYVKHQSGPQLTLMRRTPTDDHALLAQAWQAANDKARELGWIV